MHPDGVEGENGMNFLSFGEIIYDMLPDGKVLGGAPLNVAIHLARLKATSYLVSAVGTDDLGRSAIKEIIANHVNIDLIGIVDKETGRADVKIADDGTASYVFNRPAAWDNIELNDIEYFTSPSRWDGLIYGTLAQRSGTSRGTLEDIIDEFYFSERLFDVNLRGDFYSKKTLQKGIKNATILKMNEEELPLVLEKLKLDDKMDLFNMGKELGGILLTRGKDGLDYITKEKTYHQDAFDVDVVDTIGAGDSVSAAFLYYYISTNGNIEKALRKAAVLSAFVVSTKGATAPYTKELKKELGKK